jgi:D-arabinose 1-dehydrogenase-like Zn-dependent alcohol dehydrogenase
MVLLAHRWMMTAPKAPLVRTASEAVPEGVGNPAALDLLFRRKVQLRPFVEPYPLDDINRVFAAVHHRDIKRRAVLVP